MTETVSNPSSVQPAHGQPRVLVIGWDGATWDVIRPLIAEGRLPNLARLLARGAHAVLKSTLHPLSPQAWSSYETGVNPGKHGVYDWFELNLGPFTPIGAHSLRVKPFWRYLSDARDKQVVAINLLTAYPPLPVRGAVISGRMAPPGARFTWPYDLQDALLREVPGYVVDTDPSQGTQYRDMSETEYWQRNMEMVEARTRAARYVLTHYAWDVATVIYTAADIVQHYYWKYWDPTFPGHDPHGPLLEALPGIYGACDRGLGELLALAGDETVTVLLSDHGFGPTCQEVNLMAWLREEGFATPHQRASLIPTGGELLAALRRWAWSTLPGPILRQLKAHKPASLSREHRPEYETMGLDWQQTRAYALGMMGNLFVNLAGREPLGIVQPGAEYEAVRTELIDRLHAWRNPVTGQAMVRRAHRREEALSGPCLDKAPDILVEWYDYGYAGRTAGDVRGEVLSPPHEAYLRRLQLSADHRPEGILALAGPGIRPGAELPETSLLDVAPTVLHLLNEAVPTYLDGRVISAALTPEYRATHPVRTCEAPIEQSAVGDALTPAEAALIQERLKSLGYVE